MNQPFKSSRVSITLEIFLGLNREREKRAEKDARKRRLWMLNTQLFPIYFF